MELKRGDLVRWIIEHQIYEASGDVLRGIKPTYRHGIVVEVSVKDNSAAMLYCYDCKKKKESNWMVLNAEHDEFEILSGTPSG